MKCVRAVVRGRVQGVWFRAYTQEKAVALGVAGYVRNLADGTVEILAEGETSAVDALLSWAEEGSPLAAVSAVEVEVLEEGPGFSSFEVRH